MINKLAQQIFEANKKKGFWDKERNVGEMLMLVTSELAEGLEADRKGSHTIISPESLKFLIDTPDNSYFQLEFKNNIKDTFEDEIADAIIRLLDMSGGLGIDVESHITAKLRYNSLRPHKHGKAY